MITGMLVGALSVLGWVTSPEIGYACMLIGAGMVIGTVFGVLTHIRLVHDRATTPRRAKSAAAHRAHAGRPRTLTRRAQGHAPANHLEAATTAVIPRIPARSAR